MSTQPAPIAWYSPRHGDTLTTQQKTERAAYVPLDAAAYSVPLFTGAPVAPALSHAQWRELPCTRALVDQVKDLSGKLAAYTQAVPIDAAPYDSIVEAAWVLHGYRQGTPECSAFAGGVMFKGRKRAIPVSPATHVKAWDAFSAEYKATPADLDRFPRLKDEWVRWQFIWNMAAPGAPAEQSHAVSYMEGISDGRAEVKPALVPLTPDELADKCEAWLRAGGAGNLVDAYEAGFRECEQLHGIKP